MFKIGDSVVCVDSVDVCFLTINKKYLIINIDTEYDYVYVINDIDVVDWYASTRFELDIKYNRLEKIKNLNKICS